MSMYNRFNKAVHDYFFLDTQEGDFAFISMDEFVLTSITDQLNTTKETILKELGRNLKYNWWHTFYSDEDGLPLFFGLLALQTYTAYKMHNDGEFGANAYNPRLAQVLGLSDYSFQSDIQTLYKNHQDHIWERYKDWLKEKGFLHHIPSRKYGAGRYIQYPLSQALLNSQDMKVLTGYFKVLGLSPFESISKIDFFSIFDITSIPAKFKTNHFQNLLWNGQEKKEMIKEQVFRFFQTWDGKVYIPIKNDSPNNRFREEELKRHQLILDNQLNKLILREEGKGPIKTIPVDEDFNNSLYYLKDYRLSWLKSAEVSSGFFVSFCFDEEYRDYIETKYLSPGDEALFYVTENVPHHLKTFLLENGEKRRAIPDGQFILLEIKKEYGLNSPISFLVKSPGLSTYLTGGLKVDRNSWLEGAGPDLWGLGDQKVWLNGREISSGQGLRELPASEYRLKIRGTSPYRFSVVKENRNSPIRECQSGWSLVAWNTTQEEIEQQGLWFESSPLTESKISEHPVRSWINLNTKKTKPVISSSKKLVLKALNQAKYGRH